MTQPIYPKVTVLNQLQPVSLKIQNYLNETKPSFVEIDQQSFGNTSLDADRVKGTKVSGHIPSRTANSVKPYRSPKGPSPPKDY